MFLSFSSLGIYPTTITSILLNSCIIQFSNLSLSSFGNSPSTFICILWWSYYWPNYSLTSHCHALFAFCVFSCASTSFFSLSASSFGNSPSVYFESFDEYMIGLPLLLPLASMLCAFLPFCASPYLLLVIGQIRKTSSQNCQSTKPKPKDA